MYDNATLAEIYLPVPYYPKGKDIGLEIEVESLDSDLPGRLKNWRIVEDGSLRYFSAEYVSREPRSLDDAVNDIRQLCAALNKNKNILYESPRTSVHVHVNQMDYTPEQIIMHAFQWYLLEEILIKYCGKTRDSNLYCLTLQQAPGILEPFERNASWMYGIFGCRSDTHKYAALNLSSINRIYTLEARCMRGVYDPDILIEWVKTVHKILTTHPYKSVKDLLDDASDDPESFIKSFLPESMYSALDPEATVIDLVANAAILSALPTDRPNSRGFIFDRFNSENYYKKSLDDWRKHNDSNKSIQQPQPVSPLIERLPRVQNIEDLVLMVRASQMQNNQLGLESDSTISSDEWTMVESSEPSPNSGIQN